MAQCRNTLWQWNTIAQGVLISIAKDLREIRPGSPLRGRQNAGGVGQNRRLSTNNRLYLENGIDRRMVSIKVE